MSLRLRLLLTLAPLFIIGLAAADIGTYAAVQSSLLQGVDQQLVSIEPGVTDVLLHPGDQGPGGATRPRGSGTATRWSRRPAGW